MSAPVLVSTRVLPRAGKLRDAFRAEGYEVELVTPAEELDPPEGPSLLVLTGERVPAPADPLLDQARKLEIPALAQVEGPEEAVGAELVEGLLEVFGPDTGAGEVALVGRQVLERRRLQQVTGIVGETDAMREVLERVVQIAPVNSTVLVTGESGTGKELVARGIHALSPRRHEPFIAVNVAALSESLLESELFGHEKGAFTGAVDARKGLFELAHKGTIFLDEIGEMPLSTQTKLLRVLEQREFHRVGGEKPIRVDVRIVAATNQELRYLVEVREFRKDLYYRLNVLSIHLPPLRERPRDIPVLVDAFVEELEDRHDRSFPGITDEAMEILVAYRWPGNVRELRNLVESMVVLAPGRKIRPADVPPEVRGEGRGMALVHTRPARPASEGEAGEGSEGLRPGLEFVFRMMMELRMDVDELRREFERYQEEHPTVGARRALELSPPPEEALDVVALDRPDTAGEEGLDEEGAVVYRPGMTMEDLEREAILAALEEVDGNRRRAAEILGIGERTLYRKLSKYELDA